MSHRKRESSQNALNEKSLQRENRLSICKTVRWGASCGTELRPKNHSGAHPTPKRDIIGGAPILRGWRRGELGVRGWIATAVLWNLACCRYAGITVELFVDIYDVSHPYGSVRKASPFELNLTVTAPVLSISQKLQSVC